jgi:hypothetical protein
MNLAPYRPRSPARPPAVVHRAAIPASAWHGQLRDGALLHVWGDVAVAADTAPDARLRAQAVAALVPPRAVVGRRTALWVHVGRPAPERLEVLVGRGCRHTSPHPLRVSAEAELGPADVERIAAIRVTTVQRTGTDLARWLPPDLALPLVASLLPAGFDVERARHELALLRGQRNVSQARRTLAVLAGLSE